MILYRGTQDPSRQNANEGQVVHDNGFMSTSPLKEKAKGWGNLLLKMKIPAGAKVLWVSSGLSSQGPAAPGDPPGRARWKVLQRRTDGNHTMLVVEPILGNGLGV